MTARIRTVSKSLIRSRPKLIFTVTQDWYFISHRLQLALTALQQGYEVGVITSVEQNGDRIRNLGIKVFPVNFDRSGMKPHHEIHTYKQILEIYRREQPDIVHHIALKPVIYGSLAAREAGIKAVVNMLGGLGYVFGAETLRARTLLQVIKPVLRSSFKEDNIRLIIQNAGDQKCLKDEDLISSDKVRLIRGSGVNPDDYQPVSHEVAVPLVILPARLLYDKGVSEFIEAARLLKAENVQARFILVGERDPKNPACIGVKQIEQWKTEGFVEFWGWRNDMPDIFSKAQIVCLPSYHEGLPKALLEAAASGCAMVGTNISGCREIIQHQFTGLLVPRRNILMLADALKLLISSPELRISYGTAARKRLEEKFTIKKIMTQTLKIYEEFTL